MTDVEGCQARDLPDWEAWEAGGLSDMEGIKQEAIRLGSMGSRRPDGHGKVSSKRPVRRRNIVSRES